MEKLETAFTIPFSTHCKIIKMCEYRLFDSENGKTIDFSKMPGSKIKMYQFYDKNGSIEFQGDFSFGALKRFFMPSTENRVDDPEAWIKWVEICDISDLEDFLNFSYDGDEIPYRWEELEKDDCLTLNNKL